MLLTKPIWTILKVGHRRIISTKFDQNPASSLGGGVIWSNCWWRITDDGLPTTHDWWRTSNDHNSSPCANGSGELKTNNRTRGRTSIHVVIGRHHVASQHIQDFLEAFFHFCFNIKWGIQWWAWKRIHYSWEGGIEKSILRDQRLSSLGKPCDANRWSLTRIFLSHPHTNNGFLYSHCIRQHGSLKNIFNIHVCESINFLCTGPNKICRCIGVAAIMHYMHMRNKK